MNTKLAIFDLDGTLLNTLEDLKEAVNRAMMLHGFPLHTLEWVRNNIGHGLPNLIHSALPDVFKDDDYFNRDCLSFLLDYYGEHLDECTHPYHGVQEIVRSLAERGITTAVVTNKYQAGAEILIRKYFPEIQLIFGEKEGRPIKPDPAIISLICETTGIRESDTVMIGDSPTDIQTARNAGIRVIAVSWGYRSRERLADADFIADTAEELMSALIA